VDQKSYKILDGKKVPISLVLREYTQGYPIYYGYKGDEVFLGILQNLLGTGIHSIELDNPYQGDFPDGHIPIKTRHMIISGKTYGDRTLVHLRLGPDIPDVRYFQRHMDGSRKCGTGLFTSLNYEEIGYETQEEQIQDIRDSVRLLKEIGVQTLRFSVENGAIFLQNDRDRLLRLIETAIESGVNAIGLPKTCGNHREVDVYEVGRDAGNLIPNDVNIRLHLHGRDPYQDVLGLLMGLLDSDHNNYTVETTLRRSSNRETIEIPGILETNELLLGTGMNTGIDQRLIESAVKQTVNSIYRSSHLAPYEGAIGTHAAKNGRGSRDYIGQFEEEDPRRIFSHIIGKNALRDFLIKNGIDPSSLDLSSMATYIRRLFSGDIEGLDPLLFLDENGIPIPERILEQSRVLVI